MEDQEEVFDDAYFDDTDEAEEEQWYDFGEHLELSEEVPEIISTELVPYNQWCHEVSKTIALLTGHGHCIETVGFESWWRDWWQDGKSPEEAAATGLREDVLLEDD
jgi:hypothetical protein